MMQEPGCLRDFWLQLSSFLSANQELFQILNQEITHWAVPWTQAFLP